MDLQTHGAKKYPDSGLLKSSAGLGWSTIAAELRSHGVSSTPVIVPQHTEVILAVGGNDNGLISRTGAGQLQEHTPTTGSISLAPIAVGDNEATFTAPIPEMLHLYLPTPLFRRLSDDFNLPGTPGHSIRYLAGVRDEIINHVGHSVVSEMTNESAAGRMFVETASTATAALANPSNRKSPDSPTLPTVTVGLPVSFLVQPARFKSEPSNSDSQKRRWESSARCTANLQRAPGSTTCSTGWSATSSIWSRSVARCWSIRPGRARCGRPATTTCCPSSPRRSRHCPDSPGLRGLRRHFT
jgi:hypothetical protein